MRDESDPEYVPVTLTSRKERSEGA
jgi:hypothetical protein